MSWKFRTFVSATGRKDVQADINRLGIDGLEGFKAQVKYLRVAPIAEWHEPHAKKLKGYDWLYEIRFKDTNRQVRAIGFFGLGPDEFTILISATHKGNVYKPHNAFDTAETRRKALLTGDASTASLEIDGEIFPPNE